MARRLIAAVAVLLLIGSALAWADADNVIVIGGQEVLRIRADSGGFTAKQRADALRQRIVQIFDRVSKENRALTPAEVTLDLTPGKPAIRARGLLLLSITQDDARVNGYKLDDLARKWHKLLRAAMVKGAPQPMDEQYPQPMSPTPSGSPSP